MRESTYYRRNKVYNAFNACMQKCRLLILDGYLTVDDTQNNGGYTEDSAIAAFITLYILTFLMYTV